MESLPTTSPHNPAPGLTHCVKTIARHLHRWRLTARTRRQLAELDSRQLADLGISPSERVAEISKPFWR